MSRDEIHFWPFLGHPWVKLTKLVQIMQICGEALKLAAHCCNSATFTFLWRKVSKEACCCSLFFQVSIWNVSKVFPLFAGLCITLWTNSGETFLLFFLSNAQRSQNFTLHRIKSPVSIAPNEQIIITIVSMAVAVLRKFLAKTCKNARRWKCQAL